MPDSDRKLKLFERFLEYAVSCESVELKIGDDRKVFYLFRLHDLKSVSIMMVGLHTPFCSFDPQRNILVWPDTFHTMDPSMNRIIASNKKTVRTALGQDKNKRVMYDWISREVNLVAMEDLGAFIDAASQILNKEIIVDYSVASGIYYFHLVDKVLHDYRES
jgi:hypothetical protein